MPIRVSGGEITVMYYDAIKRIKVDPALEGKVFRQVVWVNSKDDIERLTNLLYPNGDTFFITKEEWDSGRIIL